MADNESFASAQEIDTDILNTEEEEDGIVDDEVLDSEDDKNNDQMMTLGRADSVEMNESNVAGVVGDTSGDSCFFADATLDLEEAQGIAETPEASDRGRSRREHEMMADAPHLPYPGNSQEDDDDEDGRRSGLEMRTLQFGDPPSKAGLSNTAVHLEQTNNSQMHGTTASNDTNYRTAVSSTNIATSNTVTTSMRRPAAPGSQFSRISSHESGLKRVGPGAHSHSSTTLPSNRPTYRAPRPQRPRDAPWAVAAATFVPLFLALPFYAKGRNSTVAAGGTWITASQSPQAHTVSILSCLFSYASTIVLGRILYRTMGGGDGDYARQDAANLIVKAQPIAFAIKPLLIILIYWKTPRALWPFAFILILFFLRDIILLRERALPSAGHVQIRTNNNNNASAHNRAGLASDDSRRTFFRALVCTALDILSRSLRRQSFYRVVFAALFVQFIVVLLWRSAIFVALSISNTFLGKIMVLFALIGGKWATGTITRILALIASGGVTAWFAQQSILIDEMERMKAKQQQQQQQQQNDSNFGDNASDDYDVGYGDGTALAPTTSSNPSDDIAARAVARAALHSMPEAYRTADASVYSPVIDFDEGMDDDFDEEEDDDDNATGNSKQGIFFRSGGNGLRGIGNRNTHSRPSAEWTGGGSGGNSTVKSFLFSAVTVSFGSVAQCGLLGGLAQVVWSLVRNADTAAAAISQRLSSSRFGFRGMNVGNDMGGDNNNNNNIMMSTTHPHSWQHKALIFYHQVDRLARAFVRSHSDLAMSHVAAYFKSYQRAANDVAALIDESGVEPIIHDDITTHMCSSLCAATSGVLVIFFGFILSHNRGGGDDDDRHPDQPHRLSDSSVCETMLISFLLCYTIIFTVMEPLRASIKAVYVCFAQHPQSLSQAFPLIFHRLSRISQSNTNMV